MNKICRRHLSHVPVMAREIVELLRPEDGKVYIDMTFGAGGHSRRLLDTNKSIKIVAVDRDPVAIKKAQELASEVALKNQLYNINQSVIPIHSQFSTAMSKINLSGIPFGSVNGILFDLGASSMQFDDPSRGFSLSSDGPLDMRMDTTNESAITAEDVINNLSQEQLGLILKLYGEERRSRKISNAIVDARTLMGRIRTTQELSKIVATSKPASLDAMGRYSHAGTKLFQALRIFVNNELNELNYGLEKMREFLIPSKIAKDETGEDIIMEPYGVMLVLTFHSLEDKIVKTHFAGHDTQEPNFRFLSQHDRIRTNVLTHYQDLRDIEQSRNWKPILKHIERPTDSEIQANPRSRSAKLRAALRLN